VKSVETHPNTLRMLTWRILRIYVSDRNVHTTHSWMKKVTFKGFRWVFSALLCSYLGSISIDRGALEW
jgi:hypothetical protein